MRMQPEDLLQAAPDQRELKLFPDKLMIGRHRFKSTYRFNPQKSNDGVTVEIPSSAAAEVRKDAMDWLVPGLLREKIA